MQATPMPRSCYPYQRRPLCPKKGAAHDVHRCTFMPALGCIRYCRYINPLDDQSVSRVTEFPGSRQNPGQPAKALRSSYSNRDGVLRERAAHLSLLPSQWHSTWTERIRLPSSS
ncbi:hypothetical protein EVAR_99538_1 [Eumeta japonica]|uniref:Uncharacterized protein n=1 Tax=Eumeta variegata TaxID=151549 RepID=A0A4C1ZMY9_EUMVA|nr:hypothetical protein EVAR_99538_1 [Eumeta japonica]